MTQAETLLAQRPAIWSFGITDTIFTQEVTGLGLFFPVKLLPPGY